jgi:valyl-tRNA synthetase
MRALRLLLAATFCDWYVEYAKPDLYGDDAARRGHVLALMTHTFASALKLLHPFMPFLTEELWHGLGYAAAHPSLMRAPWPAPATPERLAAWGATPEVAAWVDDRRDLVRAARTLRAERNLPPRARVPFALFPADPALAPRLEAEREEMAAAIGAEPLDIHPEGAPPAGRPAAVVRLGTICMLLEETVDPDAERRKLEGQIEQTRGMLAQAEAKLGNPSFTGRAPPAVVAQQETRRAECLDTLARLEKLLAALDG